MLDKKFRAWNKQLKRFIYFETWWGLGSYGDDSDCYDDIQQFTGLTDKNTGEEIYEGDIIKFSGPRFKEGTIPYQDFINKDLAL